MSGYDDNLIMTFGERTPIPIVVYPVRKSKDHVYSIAITTARLISHKEFPCWEFKHDTRTFYRVGLGVGVWGYGGLPFPGTSCSVSLCPWTFYEKTGLTLIPVKQPPRAGFAFPSRIICMSASGFVSGCL